MPIIIAFDKAGSLADAVYWQIWSGGTRGKWWGGKRGWLDATRANVRRYSRYRSYEAAERALWKACAS